MNRRKFLKFFGMGAVAATVPAVVMARPNNDGKLYKCEIGQLNGVNIVEDALTHNDKPVKRWGVRDWGDGGYMYSNDLSDSLRRALQKS